MSNEESIAVSNCPACGHFPTQFICGGDALKHKALRSPEVASLRAINAELVEALEGMVEASPCQNDCAPDDMSCATRKAESILTKAKGASND